ncbi:cytochrome P450 [Aquimarina sp. I32.4]|uniref:cytochrome P450 n=1 Tax=Aquimarina sp. I32.4 TaxID=2053903 RepID=UPI000CDF0A17|nr:cytochrome P450 [Aquimarina sp. I32.4]
MNKPKKLPPGFSERNNNDLHLFSENPFKFVEDLKSQYGHMFTLKLNNLGNENPLPEGVNGRWVFLTRPEHISSMYKAEFNTLSAAAANQIFFDTKEESLGYIEGELHRTRQSNLTRLLNATKDYVPVIQKIVRETISSWKKGAEFSLFLTLQKLTTRVISTIICGNMPVEERQYICSELLKTENSNSSREDILAADANIRSFVEKKLDGYLQDARINKKEDLLTALLELADDGDTSLTNEVIRDEVFSLLYTGFSTTANTLSWVFLHIFNDKKVYENLMKEIGEIGDLDLLTKDSLNDLHYCDAVIKETLRLHPVTALNGVRLVKKPIEIGEYYIPEGTIIVNCTYLLQRSTEFYDSPEIFSTERFVENKPKSNTWTPFGGGNRTCVGRVFSLREMKVIIIEVLSKFNLKSLEGIPKAAFQGFFMAPENKAPFVIESTVEKYQLQDIK